MHPPFLPLTQVYFLSNLLIPAYLFPFFSKLPPDSRFHNLLTLASKDIAVAPSAEAGSNMILQHQKLMLEHFRHKHHSVLPENVILRLLLGVSIIRNLRDPVLLLCDIMQYPTTLQPLF